MAYKYFRSKDNPTLFRASDLGVVDLPTYKKETGQDSIADNKLDWSSAETINDNAIFSNRFVSPGISVTSDSVRKQESDKLLEQQKQDIARETELKRLTTDKAIADLKASLTPGGNAPERPNLAQEYQGLSSKYNIDSLMAELEGLNTEINKSVDSTEAGLQIEKQRTQPRSLQTGKMEALADQGQADYNSLTRRKSAITEMLQAKTNIINNIMSLKQQDYSNAVSDYTQKFNQAISIQQQVTNYLDREQAQENQARDDARANLTVLQNLVQESGKSWEQTDIETKMNIQREEARAGLPIGTFAQFARSLPQAKLLSTSTGYDGSGNEIVSFIYADELGNPGVVRTVKTGSVKPKTSSGTAPSLSEYEMKLIENGNTYEAFEQSVGNDGFVSPQAWQKLRRSYAFNKNDFDSTFRGYINPANPQDYEGFEEYTSGFKKGE